MLQNNKELGRGIVILAVAAVILAAIGFAVSAACGVLVLMACIVVGAVHIRTEIYRYRTRTLYTITLTVEEVNS